ncbi:MAG TPA: hypothetical protein VIH52_04170 [Candidatus Nanoarchaeia archaeon]
MRKLLLVLPLLLTLFAPTVTVLAHEGEDDGDSHEQIEAKRQELMERFEARQKERQDHIASMAARIKQHLTDVKLRVCEKRQEIIKRRSVNLANRSRRHLDIFLGIAKRVDNFYNEKLVPKGIVVSNYEELKADIEAQKAELEAAVASAKTVAEGFDCSGDDPKGQLADFRAEMKLVIEALKDYREAIKNFIVAIKSAASASRSATSSAGD